MDIVTQPLNVEPDSLETTVASSAKVVQPAEIRIRGKATRVPSVDIGDRTIVSTGRWIKVASVREEDLITGATISDLDPFLNRLQKSGLKADIFTFAQRVPDSDARYPVHTEWENAAAIRITSFQEWLEKSIARGARKAVNRAKKLGVVTRIVPFSDEFVEQICHAYNETPVRQGKAFWHYKKDLNTVRHELGTYLDRSVFIGAYLGDEFIGSLKMTYCGPVAAMMQIFSVSRHFDKKPNNALIAKAVEVCELEGKTHLTYGSFTYNDADTSLTEFKRNIGFEAIALPRYYIPLTLKGRIALKCGLNRGLAASIPKPLLKLLVRARKTWLERKGNKASNPRGNEAESG